MAQEFGSVYRMGKRIVRFSMEDYLAVKTNKWLSDLHVDVFLHWIGLKYGAKEKECSFIIIQCYLWEMISNLCRAENPSIWERRLIDKFKNNNIFQKRNVIFPINTGNHWVLAVISWPVIFLFDSLTPGHTRSIETKIRRLVQVLSDRNFGQGTRSYDENTLPVIRVDCPQQGDSFNCGIYLLNFVDLYLQQITKNGMFQPHGFSQTHQEFMYSRAGLAGQLLKWNNSKIQKPKIEQKTLVALRSKLKKILGEEKTKNTRCVELVHDAKVYKAFIRKNKRIRIMEKD